MASLCLSSLVCVNFKTGVCVNFKCVRPLPPCHSRPLPVPPLTPPRHTSLRYGAARATGGLPEGPPQPTQEHPKGGAPAPPLA